MADKEKRSSDKTLGRVAEIVKKCPHFGEWDWCNAHCDLYKFCDGIYVAQRAAPPKSVSDTLKDAANKIFKESAEPVADEAL